MPIGKTKQTAVLLGGVGLLLAAIGVIVSLFLLNRPQDIRQQAAVEGGTAQIKITPTTANLKSGESTTATVSFSTEGTWIEGLTVQLQYPYTGDQSPLTASELTIDPALEASGRFNCSVKKIVSTTNPITIDVGCTTIAGYSNETFTDLFSFKLTATDAVVANPITVSFVADKTVIATAGEDIAAIPTSKLVVTLPQSATTEKKMNIQFSAQCNPSELNVNATLTDSANAPLENITVTFTFNQQQQTDQTDSSGRAAAVFTYDAAGSYSLLVEAQGLTSHTSTVQIAECSEPTPTPTPTPTATPISGTLSCDSACSTDSDCAYGYECYGGRCRNSSCQSDTTCQCETVEVASASSATELPVTGSFDRTVALLLIGGLLTLGGAQVLVGRYSRLQE